LQLISSFFLRETLPRTRVNRLGEFSLIGQLFSVASLYKITEVAQIFGLLFPQYQLYINLDKKLVGTHYGRLFRKLIWSPCLEQRPEFLGFDNILEIIPNYALIVEKEY
jgi:hypothetical protein